MREAADADGESFVTVGPMPSKEELESMLLRIKEVAHTVGCDCTVVHTQERPAADREGGPKSYGTVEMASTRDAAKAIQLLNGSEFNGRSLDVRPDAFA